MDDNSQQREAMIQQKEKELERVENEILNGTFDIKKYFDITSDAVMAIYSIGYQMYVNKKYDKAYAIFGIVDMLEPSADHFFAHAAAAFMLKNYTIALQLYGIALLHGRYNPSILEQMAECCAYLNKVDLLQKYATESIRLSQTDEFKNNKAELKYAERAKLILDGVKELLEKQKAEASEKDNDAPNEDKADKQEK